MVLDLENTMTNKVKCALTLAHVLLDADKNLS